LGVVVITLLAGGYPAFLLSGLRPATMFRGLATKLGGGALLRNVLVTFQFAILIAFIIAAAIAWQQRAFALNKATRLNLDQILVVNSQCPEAFKIELRKLPGVRDVSCAGQEIVGRMKMFGTAGKYRGKEISSFQTWLEPETYRLLGIRPLAGSLADF